MAQNEKDILLYVEDDQDVARMGTMMLQMLCPENNVMHVTNCKDAVALIQGAQEGGPAVKRIVSDWNYKDLKSGDFGGRDLYHFVAKEGLNVSFIFTPGVLPETVKEVLREHELVIADDHIFPKPLSLDSFKKIAGMLKVDDALPQPERSPLHPRRGKEPGNESLK